MTVFNLQQLRNRYEAITAQIVAECSLATELVGGQPAQPDGVRMFVQHHLKLTGEEAEAAVKRILAEEIGAKPVPSDEGELEERLSYGINIIRRTEHGPWLGNWMVKACIKAAASRLAIFQQKKGTKGDMAEMGDVRAIGCSLVEPEHPERIYLRSSTGEEAATTYFQEFKGRIQSPKGSASIIHHSECAAPGSRFAFEYRFYGVRLSENDVADTFASAMVVGLGSCKAFERGKFSIQRLEYTPQVEKRRKEEKKEEAAA